MLTATPLTSPSGDGELFTRRCRGVRYSLPEVKSPGPLLASGRDSDIFEYGPGLVLRRSRDRRSLADEARVMEYLHEHAYPVPTVDEISDDGCDLVMERIEGITMVDTLGREPWTLRRQGRVLADLHVRLHEVPPAPFLPPASVGHGDRIVHLDLHPLNVLLGPKGPVVIDWTRAARGDPAVDLALAWVLISAGAIPGNSVKGQILGLGRQLLLNSFLARFDRAEVAQKLREVVTAKVQDPHMSPAEIQSMWKLVDRAERRW